VTSAIGKRTKTIGSALLAAALLFSVWSVADPPEADAACGSHNGHVTDPRSLFRAWNVKLRRMQSVKASWGDDALVSRSGTCRDVNVKNVNRSNPARAYYWSWSLRRWVHGSRGWVWGRKGRYVVVISDIADGALFRAGAPTANTVQIAMT